MEVRGQRKGKKEVERDARPLEKHDAIQPAGRSGQEKVSQA